MNNKFLLTVGLSTLVSSTVFSSDPIVMTVNGVDIPRSEFEYLFHKNNQQQLVPQTLEDYVEMFKIYKLKVADAKALGLDTTESFKKEMNQYRRELAAPFIADSAFIDKMANDMYVRSKEEVEVSFIKIPKTRNPYDNKAIKNKADSIRTILVNGADFAETAKVYSQDVAADLGGYHGYMTVGRLPYQFEEALYTVSPNEISDVVELPDGYYILKPGQRRPTRGKVEVAHILKLIPANASEAQISKSKSEIDSIYNILVESPFQFGELAIKYSDDKASGRQEGKLPAFASGEMVPEFEEVAFSMNEGTISEPFQSKFGWHIVKKFKNIPAPGENEVKEDLKKRVSNPQDARYRVVREHEIENLVKKHNGKIFDDKVSKMKNDASQAGIDSLYLANWTTMPLGTTVVGKVGDKDVTAEEVINPIKRMKNIPADQASEVIDQAVTMALGSKALVCEEDLLYSSEPSYRNLMDEYTDGSLLYEVSLMKVWDKSSKDIEGLNDYFLKNKEKYKWEKPHVKGILVQSLNDSISDLVRNRLKEVNADKDSIATLKKEFSGKAVLEYIVMEEGVNPMVDNIMFNGLAARPKIANFNEYFIFEPRLIEYPEEMTDVRGDVTMDYQSKLEEDWINELLKKYPVVINYDEIMKVK